MAAFVYFDSNLNLLEAVYERTYVVLMYVQYFMRSPAAVRFLFFLPSVQQLLCVRIESKQVVEIHPEAKTGQEVSCPDIQ